LGHVFDRHRWGRRFRTEQSTQDDTHGPGRAPDATVDDVGAAPPKSGFAGRPLPDGLDAGQGNGGATGISGGVA
jgi:hypothetical protein